MTGGWLVVACLATAGMLLGWPIARRRARRRAVLTPGHPARDAFALPSGRREGRRDVRPGEPVGRAGREVSPEHRWWRWADPLVLSARPRRPRRVVLVVGIVSGCLGAFAGGPVAAIAAGAYAGLAARGVVRRRIRVLTDQEHRRQLDQLCALAADLRAGLPPPLLAHSAAGPAPIAAPSLGAGRIAELTRAATRLAEETGAPLADLVERIEADARAMDRGLAAAEAQAAGARATAWLLAGLPLGGIALGYGIGVDPLRILLHTPIGAACAVGAIVLQLAGLGWADRLSGGPTGNRATAGVA
ncbi:type II secretion system F family protein [Plantactinospora sp. CA-290183]|uniref:type II secretion system F family protein n=1 Tax=Plantactinospora sp. CA-290183 TaxID=3240006 RepID=UPI003D9015DB